MGVITDILKEIPLSAVLREKILTLEEQLLAKEKKMSILETTNQELETKVAILETQLNESQKKNEELRYIINNHEQVSNSSDQYESYDPLGRDKKR